MKSFSKKIVIALIFAGMVVVGCEGEYDSLVDANQDRHPIPDTEVEASQGDANFSNYVAIGSSLTAGYMDGALYNNGQQFSLGALLSAQFAATGAPSTFNQPDINSINGFNTIVNDGSGQVLGRFKLDTSIPGPSPTINGDPIEPYTGETSALNNFGVPGIQVGQLLTAGTGSPSSPAFNPFYARFASSPGSSTILGDVISANPSFFTLWIGNNDVLGYALSGATNNDIFTSSEDFETRFDAVVNTLLTNTEAEGVVATIPPILTTPIFRAVPHNPIPLTQQQADQLNQGYAEYNGGVEQSYQAGLIGEGEKDRRMINFTAGANRFVMVDNDLTDLTSFGLPNWRQSEPTDLVLLSAAQAFPTGVGTQSAAPASLVLTQLNQDEIQERINSFNQIIATAVSQNSDRLALLDVNKGLPGHPDQNIGVFADLLGLDGERGIRVEGILLAPDFSPNGVFSTDGVHPNARGNAILANEFLRVIESEFGATIPKVDVLALPSVAICAGDCVSQQDGS